MKFQYSRSCSMWMILALGCFVYFFFVRNMWIENEILFHNKIFPCNWQSGDPILYNLRASPHVNFEGNHWFHVAENFMVEHSILRADGGFVSEMNAMTKFMVAIGLTTGKPKSFHYVHSNQLNFDHISVGTGITIFSNYFEENEAYSLGDLPPQDRFVVTSTAAHSGRAMSALADGLQPGQGRGLGPEHVPGVCVKFAGSVGGKYPTPQRGHWFPNPGDVSSFRDKVKEMCSPRESDAQTYRHLASPPSPPKGKDSKLRLVVYQRDVSRKIADLESSLEEIRSKLDMQQWTIEVKMHQSDESPCSLALALHDADVLLTSHGFQSMLLLLLPLPSLIFEVFPYRYYKRAYGPLAGEYGVVHAGVMSPPVSWMNRLVLSSVRTSTCMQNIYCRSFARGDDVRLTSSGVQRLLGAIREMLELRQGGGGASIFSTQ